MNRWQSINTRSQKRPRNGKPDAVLGKLPPSVTAEQTPGTMLLPLQSRKERVSPQGTDRISWPIRYRRQTREIQHIVIQFYC